MSPQLKQEAVGAHIRHLRTDRGMSVRKLAAQTDFSPSFISQVENGFGRVPTESMEAWARALGVEPPAFARRRLLDLDLRRFDQLRHLLGIGLAEGGDLVERLDDGR